MSATLRVPRYTSYPTAPNFRPLGRDVAESALARVGEELSVYVHVPFCERLCWYCGCHRVVSRRRATASPYTDDLLAEIGLLDAHMPAGRRLKQLAFGGGTPSFLLEADLGRLMEGLVARWPRVEDAEWSMEIDPRTVDADRLRQLRGLGFNRFSFGVQDIDQRVMRAVNREQPAELSEELVAAARERTGVGVSMDLMYGLPFQTEASWRATLAWAVALGPDRLSVFPYAHVPWMQPQQRLIERDLPETGLRTSLRDIAWSALAEAGYQRIGMDHFARADDSLIHAQRQGTLQRNFQGYSTHRGLDMIGLGASAIGSYGGVYTQNSKDLGDYSEQVRAGVLPVVRGFELSAEDVLRRDVITDLLCRFQVRFSEHGSSSRHFADELLDLRTLEEDGLIRIDADGVSVLDTGLEEARVVAAAFDQYLGDSGARYSKLY